MYNYSKLQSVIDDRCDIKTAFSRVLNYFDPNKNKNRKSKVLDVSYSYIWTDEDLKRYQIDKTSNLAGSVLDCKYDIIIYESLTNKKIFQSILRNYQNFLRS